MAASPTPRRSSSGCAIASIPAAILVTSIAAAAPIAETEVQPAPERRAAMNLPLSGGQLNAGLMKELGASQSPV